MHSKKKFIGLALCIMALGAGGTVYAWVGDEDIQPQDIRGLTFRELVDSSSAIALEEARNRLNNNNVKKDDVFSFLTSYSNNIPTLGEALAAFIGKNKSAFSDSDLYQVKSSDIRNIQDQVQSIIKERESAKSLKEISEKTLDDVLLLAAYGWGENQQAHKKELERRLPGLTSDEFVKFLGSGNFDLKGRPEVKNRFTQILNAASQEEIRGLANNASIPSSLRDQAENQLYGAKSAKSLKEISEKTLTDVLNGAAHRSGEDQQAHKKELERRLPGLTSDEFVKFLGSGNFDLKGRPEVKNRFTQILTAASQEEIRRLANNHSIPSSLRDQATQRLEAELSKPSAAMADKELRVLLEGIGCSWGDGYKAEVGRRVNKSGIDDLRLILISHKELGARIRGEAGTQFINLLKEGPTDQLRKVVRDYSIPSSLRDQATQLLKERLKAKGKKSSNSPTWQDSYYWDADTNCLIPVRKGTCADPVEKTRYEACDEPEPWDVSEYNGDADGKNNGRSSKRFANSESFLNTLVGDNKMLRLAKGLGFSRDMIYLLRNSDDFIRSNAYDKEIKRLQSIQKYMLFGDSDGDFEEGVPAQRDPVTELNRIMLDFTNKVLEKKWGKLYNDGQFVSLKQDMKKYFDNIKDQNQRAEFRSLMIRNRDYIQGLNNSGKPHVPFLKKIRPAVLRMLPLRSAQQKSAASKINR